MQLKFEQMNVNFVDLFHVPRKWVTYIYSKASWITDPISKNSIKLPVNIIVVGQAADSVLVLVLFETKCANIDWFMERKLKFAQLTL